MSSVMVLASTATASVSRFVSDMSFTVSIPLRFERERNGSPRLRNTAHVAQGDRLPVPFDLAAGDGVVTCMMHSPQSDTEHWEKLIRAVRGRPFARFWYLYKTGQLANAVSDQDQSSETDKARLPVLGIPEDGQRIGMATASAMSAG